MIGRIPCRAEVLRRSVRISGPGALAAIEAVGAPHMRDVKSGGWLVPISHAADVIAHLEYAQRRIVEFVEVAS